MSSIRFKDVHTTISVRDQPLLNFSRSQRPTEGRNPCMFPLPEVQSVEAYEAGRESLLENVKTFVVEMH